MSKIIMLGTGNALVSRLYNTCFLLEDGASQLLVDGGGGNVIFARLEKVGRSALDIRNIFVTHAHTDHIIGVLWVLRLFAQRHTEGLVNGVMNVWSHTKVIDVLRYMSEAMLTPDLIQYMERCICWHDIDAGDTFYIGTMLIECFDVRSSREKQLGFCATLSDGQRVVCLGDEPYNEANRAIVQGADWLMCEAFCLYADSERFHPYEKHHSTVRDAARLAEELQVSNLILYHTEDKTGKERKHLYTSEAKVNYNGNVFVPEDMEEITL